MKTLLLLILALGAVSCAKKPTIVEKTQKTVQTAPVQTPVLTDIKPTTPNHGLRINEDDILALPTTDQLRTNNNTTAITDSPIIVRPPSE